MLTYVDIFYVGNLGNSPKGWDQLNYDTSPLSWINANGVSNCVAPINVL